MGGISQTRYTIRAVSAALLGALMFLLALGDPSVWDSFRYAAPVVGAIHGLTWVNRLY